jgi:hypothetical protein
MLRKLTLMAFALLFVALVAHRVRRYAQLPATLAEPGMPAAVGEAEERAIHLEPGGKYTLADIEANGRMIPSQKYRGFRARHDFSPQPGDRLCPVSRTKANSDCTWTVGGFEYQFCCPPCIDEFVLLAKERPEDVQPPDAYVNR